MLYSEWTSSGGRYPIAECNLDSLYQATHADFSANTSINPDHTLRSINSAFYTEFSASAIALSNESPRDPTDATISDSARASP